VQEHHRAPVGQGTQERDARTSRSRRRILLPSAIRSDTEASGGVTLMGMKYRVLGSSLQRVPCL
jgi:hypothetical protein